MNALMKLILDSCLTNAGAQVRGNACLGLIHHPSIARDDIPVLTKLLDDPDPHVRRHAASALTSIRGSGSN
jgi:HEAT repeat protein